MWGEGIFVLLYYLRQGAGRKSAMDKLMARTDKTPMQVDKTLPAQKTISTDLVLILKKIKDNPSS